jgi:hypothetical protein
MKIGVHDRKLRLNHWQVGIEWGKPPEFQMEISLHDFYIYVWCFNLRSLPPEGQPIKGHYWGFRFWRAFALHKLLPHS